jgi:hypothetical protein
MGTSFFFKEGVTTKVGSRIKHSLENENLEDLQNALKTIPNVGQTQNIRSQIEKTIQIVSRTALRSGPQLEI